MRGWLRGDLETPFGGNLKFGVLAVDGGQITLVSTASAGQVKVRDGAVTGKSLGTIRITGPVYISPSLYVDLNAEPTSIDEGIKKTVAR
jgi:hypothetical protein